MTPTIIELRAEDITVEHRRREDYGDIIGLADSIDRLTQLHPIIVDDENRLVAGERRLRAIAYLGRETILARRLNNLTDAERRLIELEENTFRKDLTPHERNKFLMHMVETAAEIDREELRSGSDRNSQRGRPVLPGSDRRVSERLGIPKTTIVEARQHVAAVESHPAAMLETMPQAEAVVVAAGLDATPDERRPDIAAAVAQREPAAMAEAKARAAAAKDQRRQERETQDRILRVVGDPDGKIALAQLRKQWFDRVGQARTMIALDPDAVADALSGDEAAASRRFIGDARLWLDRLESSLGRGVRLVKGGQE